MKTSIRLLMLFILLVAIYAGGMRAVLHSRPSSPVAVLTFFVLAASVPILLTLGKHRR